MSEFKDIEKKALMNYQDYSPDEEDAWHTETGLKIQKYLDKELKTYLGKGKIILNAGSGGECYGIKDDMIHLDIVKKNIETYPHHIISSITDIPLADESVDIIICVGSVINYTDARKSILEFHRILKKGGILILEFERSDTADLLFDKRHHEYEVEMRYEYQKKEHILTLYSEKYMLSVLKGIGMATKRKQRFHTISSLLSRLGMDEEKASKYIKSDIFFKPVSYPLSHNIILTAAKTK